MYDQRKKMKLQANNRCKTKIFQGGCVFKKTLQNILCQSRKMSGKQFETPIEKQSLCGKKTLDKSDVSRLIQAVEEDYYAEMIIGSTTRRSFNLIAYSQCRCGVMILFAYC